MLACSLGGAVRWNRLNNLLLFIQVPVAWILSPPVWPFIFLKRSRTAVWFYKVSQSTLVFLLACPPQAPPMWFSLLCTTSVGGRASGSMQALTQSPEGGCAALRVPGHSGGSGDDSRANSRVQPGEKCFSWSLMGFGRRFEVRLSGSCWR